MARRKKPTSTRTPRKPTAGRQHLARSSQPQRHEVELITPPGPLRARIRKLVADDETHPLGGSNSDEIAAVAAQHLGQEAELEASELMIAVESLAHVISARLRKLCAGRDSTTF